MGNLSGYVGNARGRFFFLLLAASFQLGSAAGAPQDTLKYLWPTNASRSLSSTFAETRDGHFHYGIDIRTNNSVGYPCYAVDDGSVVRVRVSPYGYGRALYLQLKDGRTAVYAHLQRFTPQVETIVKREQYRRRSFRYESYFNPGELSFKKGQIVAYTGSSGVGYPHLHFEIRDGSGYMNPGRYGFTVKDNQSPRPEKVAVFPLSVDSEVESGFEPVVFRLPAGAGDYYELPQTPAVYGTIALGISGYDRTDDAPNATGLYGLDFRLDDSLCFSAHYDSIGFEKSKMIELERDYRLRRRTGETFHHLWRDPRCDVGFYRAGNGIIDTGNFSPGLHSFEILLSDFAGNTARVSGHLNFQEEPLYPIIPEFSRFAGFFGARLLPEETETEVTNSKSRLKADFFDDYVAFSLALPKSAESAQLFLLEPYTSRIPLVKTNGRTIGKIPLLPHQSSPWTVEVQVKDLQGNVHADTAAWFIQPVAPEGGAAVSEDGRFRANFPPEAVHSTLYVRVSEQQTKEKSQFASRIYTLDPLDVPIRGKVEVSVSIPSEEKQPDKLGIYYLSKKGKWVFMDNDRKAAYGTISGSSPSLEKFALMKDTNPPELRWLSPAFTTTDRRPTFRFRVEDELSGIDDRSISLEIDGQWVLMEYDFEAERVFGQLEEPLGFGDHQIDFRVRDFCGNEAGIQKTITIVRP